MSEFEFKKQLSYLDERITKLESIASNLKEFYHDNHEEVHSVQQDKYPTVGSCINYVIHYLSGEVEIAKAARKQLVEDYNERKSIDEEDIWF